MTQVDYSRRKIIKAGAKFSALASLTSATSLGLLGSPISLMAQTRTRGISGQKAPELKVPYWIGPNGKESDAFSLAANKGKWIILKCFQNWCPGCHSVGFPSLQKIHAAFKDSDKVAIAAIQTTFEGYHTNTRSALAENQSNYDLDIPFGHDQGDPDAGHNEWESRPMTMLEYKTEGTPWFIVIDPNGYVAFNHFHVRTEQLIAAIQKDIA